MPWWRRTIHFFGHWHPSMGHPEPAAGVVTAADGLRHLGLRRGSQWIFGCEGLGLGVDD